MKKLIVGIFTLVIVMSCKEEKNEIVVNYPETKTVDTVDTYFGEEVKDPYRWLEDDRSEETGAWVKSQNKSTYDYLDNIPFRNELKERLSSLWNYEKVSAPFIEGDYTYYSKNDGLQNQSVLYRKKGDSEAEVFLNPNTFSDDGTVSLAGASFSKDSKMLAYSISEGGSDWRKIILMDVETKTILEDTLIDVKFSGVSWYKNEGFYYSSYDKPKGSELSAKTDQHKVYYHKLGTPQSEDALIFGSGMAAISAALFAFLQKGDHIIIQQVIYGGTFNLIVSEFDKFGIEYSFTGSDKVEDFKPLIKKNKIKYKPIDGEIYDKITSSTFYFFVY